MFEKQNDINAIIEKLSFLKNKVELSNPLNLTDVNIIAENFYRDLLNLIFGYELSNINIVTQNAASIDLGDLKNNVAIQVTSTSALKKTKETVTKFIEKKLCNQYKRLIIFNIVNKATHKEKAIGDPNIFELNTQKDIWDISDLIKEINDLDTARVKEIRKFLDKEIRFLETQAVSKEIKTFIALIEYLSDENQPAAGNGFIEEPDPDRKINSRFSDHSEFLKTQYQDLYVEYGQVLNDVSQQSDIGFTRVRRLGLHLKKLSDTVLTEKHGNAIIALETLVESFCDILKRASLEYDESAVRFFLVDQLIRCNVFPNKEVCENE